MADVRPLIGVCPQNNVFWDSLTAREHVVLFAGLRGVVASDDDAAACLEDAERMMRLCPASCLGLGIPDNSSSHSCQLWAQRDECVKNAGFMKDACASTCSEHLFREQTKLRLARNTLGGRPC